MNNARKLLNGCFGLFSLFVVASCGSNAVKNQYYILSSSDTFESVELTFDGALGIGPIKIPEFLDSPSVVTLANKNRIQTSETHLWAADVKQAISRVLVDGVSGHIEKQDVWAFPWDTRTRPERQVAVFIDEAHGVLGGDYTLKARWKVLSDYGKKTECVRRFSATQKVSENSYEAYVVVMNNMLNQMALAVSKSLKCSEHF